MFQILLCNPLHRSYCVKKMNVSLLLSADFFPARPTPKQSNCQKKRIQGEDSRLHAALKAFTGSDPQKLLECTVGAAVPNPNPPAGASRSRACPAVPARSPWVQLVTRRDAGNRISPIRSSVLPSSAPLPTQPQPKRRKSRRVAKCLLSFGELGRAWISKESRSPGNSCCPRSQGTVVPSLRCPDGCGIWTPPAGWESGSHGPELLCCPAPTSSSLGSEPRTGSHRPEAGGWGGGTILCSRRSQRHKAGQAP